MSTVLNPQVDAAATKVQPTQKLSEQFKEKEKLERKPKAPTSHEDSFVQSVETEASGLDPFTSSTVGWPNASQKRVKQKPIEAEEQKPVEEESKSGQFASEFAGGQKALLLPKAVEENPIATVGNTSSSNGSNPVTQASPPKVEPPKPQQTKEGHKPTSVGTGSSTGQETTPIDRAPEK